MISIEKERERERNLFFFLVANQTLEILPNVAQLAVESGRIYTFICRSNRSDLIPEWIYENQNSLSDKQYRNLIHNKQNKKEKLTRFLLLFKLE